MEHFDLFAGERTLYGVLWPAQQARAVLCLIHGMGEYAERYDTTARFYQRNGLHVAGIDLPGYGHDTGPKGHIGTREEIMGVLQALVNYVKYRFPGLPIFFFGHSLGGNLCLTYRMTTRRQDIAGYILSSPWLRLYFPLSVAKILALRTTARIAPRKLFNIKSTLKQEKQLLNQSPPRRPADVGADFIRDELLRPYATVHTMVSRMRDAKLILAHPEKSRVPLFVFQGDHDRVCSAEASRQFVKQSGSACRFVPVKNGGHETMHHPDYFKVLAQSLDFVNTILERRGRSSC